MKLPTGTRLALVIGATALLIALALTGALPQRYVMVAVGIVLARIAAVKAARARSEGSRAARSRAFVALGARNARTRWSAELRCASRSSQEC
jgi:peptidoglycan/LPS O-acetylase OafA/YrhL